MSVLDLTSQTNALAHHIAFEPNTGCWLWTGALNTHGYAQVKDGGRQPLVHRLLFEAAYGFKPEIAHHRCRAKCCVNPEHVEAVSHKEHGERHAAEQERWIRSGWAANRSREHCRNGHRRSEENVDVAVHSKSGRRYRRCKACVREAQRRYAERQVGERARTLAAMMVSGEMVETA